MENTMFSIKEVPEDPVGATFHVVDENDQLAKINGIGCRFYVRGVAMQCLDIVNHMAQVAEVRGTRS